MLRRFPAALYACSLLFPAHPQTPPARADGFELVAHLALDTHAADIWVNGRSVYLGSSVCGHGVRVVDAADPARPRALPALPADPQGNYEDVVAIHAETVAFSGDLLAVGVQPCGERGTVGPRGVQFFDVTDPAKPVTLGSVDTAFGVHELSMAQRGSRVLAFLAVPNSERRGGEGDFRIVDATDPRRPRQIAEWGIYRTGFRDEQLLFTPRPVVYGHSVQVNEDATIAFVSYWDAGVVSLDISDPASPVYLGRTRLTAGDGGAAHSAFPILRRNLLLQANEDFSIGGAILEAAAPASVAGRIPGLEFAFAARACSLDDISGDAVYVGRACAADNLTVEPRGRIALIDGAGCGFAEKLLRAQRAGAVAAVLARAAGAGSGPGPDPIRIPGLLVAPAQLDRLREAAAAQTVRLRISAPDKSWGFLEIYDITNLISPQRLSTFGTANALKCPPPDRGVYTLHNPAVQGDIAYLSWYSDGVRAVDISDPLTPREVGYFVPPDSTNPDFIDGKASVWGVYVQGDLVYLSDEQNGLWILRLEAARRK